MSRDLKLLALDTEDLSVLSAHVQDALLKASGISYIAAEKRLILPMNRFAWEAKEAKRWFFKKFERKQSVLHFDRVSAIRSQGIDRSSESQVLSLLAVTFTSSDHAPAGTIELLFSDQITLQAEVECIEAQLSDLGAAWEAQSSPNHKGADGTPDSFGSRG